MAGFAAARECARKEQLIERLRAAMDEIVALTRREMEAQIANNADLRNTVSQRLEKARERKDSLLLEYQGHINSHRC